MLKKITKADSNRTGRGTYAIVAATYNREYTDALVQSAQNELKGAKYVEIIRIPGSFEIPAIASRLASMKRPKFDAIICFGVIFQGKTSHAQNISEAVSNALAILQIQSKKPIIHGVLHFENQKQAQIRCFGVDHNRGIEAARTAIKMVEISRNLDALEKF